MQAISHGTARDLTRRGLRAQDITVIPPGIDHGMYRPGPPSDRSAVPTLLYVGRLKRYKGLDLVLDLLPGLGIPDLRFINRWSRRR